MLVDIAATAPIAVISNVGTSKVLIIWVNVQKVGIFTRNHSKNLILGVVQLLVPHYHYQQFARCS